MEVEIDTKALETALRNVPGRLSKSMRMAFDQIGARFIGKVQRERLSGNPLRVRSKSLRESFKHITSGGIGDEGTSLILTIFSTSPYARIHEYGGTITPRKAGALTIPLSGSPAHTADAKQKRGLARSQNLHLQRMGDNAFLADQSGAPWYVLKRSVTIPPRLGLRTLWKEYKENIFKGINAAIKRALAGGEG